MTKINWNFFLKIKEKLTTDKNAYVKIKLELSKKFFALVAVIYFFLYISVVSSFLTKYTSLLLYAFFPVFVFAIFALIYDMFNYLLVRNSDKANVYRMPLLVICILVWLAIVLLYYIL